MSIDKKPCESSTRSECEESMSQFRSSCPKSRIPSPFIKVFTKYFSIGATAFLGALAGFYFYDTYLCNSLSTGCACTCEKK